MSILYARNEFKIQNSKFKIVSERSERTLGGYCGGVPPLPIPNREVKPACADGTAMQCGRVGDCLLYLRSSRSNDFEDLFFMSLFFLLRVTHYYIRTLYYIYSMRSLACLKKCLSLQPFYIY